MSPEPHVVEDIPNIINTCKSQHPTIEISLADHLGASPLMVELLVSSANTMKAI